MLNTLSFLCVDSWREENVAQELLYITWYGERDAVATAPADAHAVVLHRGSTQQGHGTRPLGGGPALGLLLVENGGFYGR